MKDKLEFIGTVTLFWVIGLFTGLGAANTYHKHFTEPQVLIEHERPINPIVTIDRTITISNDCHHTSKVVAKHWHVNNSKPYIGGRVYYGSDGSCWKRNKENTDDIPCNTK